MKSKSKQIKLNLSLKPLCERREMHVMDVQLKWTVFPLILGLYWVEVVWVGAVTVSAESLIYMVSHQAAKFIVVEYVSQWNPVNKGFGLILYICWKQKQWVKYPFFNRFFSLENKNVSEEFGRYFSMCWVYQSKILLYHKSPCDGHLIDTEQFSRFCKQSK